MNDTLTKYPLATRRQRGSASALLMVTVIVFVFATTTAITIVLLQGIEAEARWWARQRAELNAETGCVKAETAVKAQAPRLVKRLLAQANRESRFDLNQPVLAGLRTETIHAEWNLTDADYGPDERAEADIDITLSGPPESRSPAGVPGNRAGVVVDDYWFFVTIRAKGSSGKYSARAQSHAQLRVSTISGPVDSPFFQRLVADSRTGPGAEGLSPGSAPAAAADNDSGFAFSLDSVEIVPISFGGGFVPVPGLSSPGTWSGDPEVVSGPTLVGLPNGDGVYVYYLRGVPQGTLGHLGTTVLCTDNWRFSGMYNQATDTAPFDGSPGNPAVNRYGTPRYAVVTVRAPRAAQGLTAVGADYARIILPGGRPFVLPPISDQWIPNITTIDYAGSRYRVTGEPLDPLNRSTIQGRGAMAGGDSSPTGNPPTAQGPEIGRSNSNITVEGYAQDLGASGSLFPQVGGRLQQTGPTTISLLSVVGKTNNLNLSWSGSPAATVANSAHTTFAPEDAPAAGEPPPPDPTCPDCTPPPRQIAFVAVMFLGGDIRVVTPEVERPTR